MGVSQSSPKQQLGSRGFPEEQLAVLAERYDIPHNILSNYDLFESEEFEDDWSGTVEVGDLKRFFIEYAPILVPKNTQNQAFDQAVDLHRKIKNAPIEYSMSDLYMGQLDRCFDLYNEATSEVSDGLSSPLMQCSLVNQIALLIHHCMNEIIKVGVDAEIEKAWIGLENIPVKELMRFRGQTRNQIRLSGRSVDEDLCSFIELLGRCKSSGWTRDLADYYFALRYIMGISDSMLDESNLAAAGIEMMHHFGARGNSFCRRYLKFLQKDPGPMFDEIDCLAALMND